METVNHPSFQRSSTLPPVWLADGTCGIVAGGEAGIAVLNRPGLNVMGHGRHRTASTFIRFEHPALADLATIIPFAAGSTFEWTGPISKGGVFQSVRGSVTGPSH
jgi:hypothetical protein